MFPSSATFSIASFFIFLLIFHAPALATSLPPLNKTRLNCCVLEQRPVLYRNDREKVSFPQSFFPFLFSSGDKLILFKKKSAHFLTVIDYMFIILK